MKKVSLILLSFLLLCVNNSFPDHDDIFLDYVPSPRLIEPRGDKIDLAGKTGLVFGWDRHVSAKGSGKYYDFRIYKGAEMVASELVYSRILPGDEYGVEVSSDVFDVPGNYTWSLRLGYRTRGKSRRSSGSFTITQK
jgi:hypothetical protein